MKAILPYAESICEGFFGIKFSKSENLPSKKCCSELQNKFQKNAEVDANFIAYAYYILLYVQYNTSFGSPP